MDDQLLPTLLFDKYIKGWWCFTLQNTLLRMPPPRLFITEGHRLDTTHQIGERRVNQQVAERITVSSCDKLHATLGDSAGRSRFQFGTNFVDNDHLRHVIFDSLNHHGVLFGGACHLHTPRTTNARMGNIAITRDLV